MPVDDVAQNGRWIAFDRIAVAAAALEGVAKHVAGREGHVTGLRSEFVDADGEHLVEIGGETGDRLHAAGVPADEVASASAGKTAELADRIRHFDAVAEHHRVQARRFRMGVIAERGADAASHPAWSAGVRDEPAIEIEERSIGLVRFDVRDRRTRHAVVARAVEPVVIG